MPPATPLKHAHQSGSHVKAAKERLEAQESAVQSDKVGHSTEPKLLRCSFRIPFIRTSRSIATVAMMAARTRLLFFAVPSVNPDLRRLCAIEARSTHVSGAMPSFLTLLEMVLSDMICFLENDWGSKNCYMYRMLAKALLCLKGWQRIAKRLYGKRHNL